MNAKIVILSCLGVLLVILNKPLGEALYRAQLGMGYRASSVWLYRGTLIFYGVLLTCASFAYD